MVVEAPAARVFQAFFSHDDLAYWWAVERSVAVPAATGPYAVTWPASDASDEVLGQLGGTLHGTVMDYTPDRDAVRRRRLLAAAGGRAARVRWRSRSRCEPEADAATTRVTVRQSASEDGPRWRRYFALTEPGWTERARDAEGLPRERVALPRADHQAGAAREPARARADVVIVGGGVVGLGGRVAPAAGRLHRPRSSSSSAIRTYARASSFLAMGGIRQQFGSAVCVQMVQHSVRAVARVRRADAHADAHAARVVPPARLSVPGRRRQRRRR